MTKTSPSLGHFASASEDRSVGRALWCSRLGCTEQARRLHHKRQQARRLHQASSATLSKQCHAVTRPAPELLIWNAPT